MPVQSLIDFVQRRMPVRAVPHVPEILLHQADPRSGLRRWAEQAGYADPPYWAHAWGGGLVLARCLLDEPYRVAGLSVLDLGTGSGLVAIAAALAGAARVLAADIDPRAITVAELNAALNQVTLDTIVGDLAEASPSRHDVVLCGDVFYEAALATRAAAFLDQCVAAGCAVLVGDPGRAYLPAARLDPILSRRLPDFGSGAATTVSTVYRFRQS